MGRDTTNSSPRHLLGGTLKFSTPTTSCDVGSLVGCGLCALCFLVVEVIVRRGGGSASNSKNKRTTERGIKLVRLLFQRTSRRNFAKYCTLTVVRSVPRFKVI